MRRFNVKKMIWPLILLAIMISAMPMLGIPVAQGAHFDTEILAVQSLIGNVKALGLKQGQENSLTKKLDAAIKHLEKDRTRGACQKLNDFIDQVNAFVSSGVLDPVDGQDLIHQAEDIRDIGLVC